MRLYRLGGSEFARKLNGKGAAIKGARWNPKGVPMIYTASNQALTLAEVLAHFKEIGVLPTNYVMITYEATGRKGIRRPEVGDLPAGWNAQAPPYNTAVQQYGAEFIRSDDFLLRIPSAIVPSEWNYLINPRHRKGRLRIVSVVPFVFDARFEVFLPKP